jgi:hypothetical protein
MEGSLEARVAVNSDNIADLQEEMRRVRDTLHKRAVLGTIVESLRREVDELGKDLPLLARQAAREAVAEARRTRHADVGANLRVYAAVASAGAALATIIILLVLR